MEANTTIARLNPVEASWLAKDVRASLDKEREAAGEVIERDLQVGAKFMYPTIHQCPPLQENLSITGYPEFPSRCRARYLHTATTCQPNCANNSVECTWSLFR